MEWQRRTRQWLTEAQWLAAAVISMRYVLLVGCALVRREVKCATVTADVQ